MQSPAIVFHRANQPSLEDITLPPAESTDVTIQIHYSGISPGTENSIINGARTHNGTFPLVSGYMAAGHILSVGSDVKNLSPGDAVISWGSRMEGINPVWGAHSSHHICTSASVTRIPEGVPLWQAASWVPPRVGLHAVEVSDIREGDIVLISGLGVIGFFFAQWARLRGARVIALEPDAYRADLARRQGNLTVIDPNETHLEDKVFAACGHSWPTVVVEATGRKTLIPQTLRFIKNTGTRVVFLSWYADEITLDFASLHNQEATAFFPSGAGSDATGLKVLTALADKTISVDPPFLQIYPLHQAEELFSLMSQGHRGLMSAVIDWRSIS